MIVYRIVTHDPPEDSDYLTFREMGRVLRNPTPESERWATGYSILNSLEAARHKAKRKPWLGVGYIGVYQLPEDADFRIEQTGQNRAHYTLWCSADLLRSSLVDVVPIEEEKTNV